VLLLLLALELLDLACLVLQVPLLLVFKVPLPLAVLRMRRRMRRRVLVWVPWLLWVQVLPLLEQVLVFLLARLVMQVKPPSML